MWPVRRVQEEESQLGQKAELGGLTAGAETLAAIILLAGYTSTFRFCERCRANGVL